jgi:hypothetical protein
MLALAVVTAVAPAATSSAAVLSNSPSELVVELDRTTVTAGPGERFGFESAVTNTGETDASRLVAHLNILTTDPAVYVDPEDWSAQRTQYLDLSAGETVSLDWSVQAVTSGPLVLYVAVTDLDSGSVVSSGPMELTVEGQRVVESTQVLPLVTWMPAGVLVLLAATLLRRRLAR